MSATDTPAAPGWWHDVPTFTVTAPNKHTTFKKHQKGKGSKAEAATATPAAAQPVSVVLATDPRVVTLRAQASEALEADVVAFEKKRRDQPTSDDKWMRNVLAHGTLTDKVCDSNVYV
jgi:hypothetical protein